ncbi:tagaturonate reductase [Elusimicrobium simillimum]|uniref:tagaturonate reductase n=1 Tax=Elusimicrobium simillimum TaxID=3143438 RepID=UPI003C6FEB3A
MKKINEVVTKVYGKYPEKILQIGEGNFLRAFADWMVDVVNEAGDYKGSILLTTARSAGKSEILNKQDGLYTVVTRGIDNGQLVSQTRAITSVSKCLNILSDYAKFIGSAKNPELEVVISNTTEAGISYKEEDKITDTPPSSFPAKMTAFLYERFKAFNGDNTKGLLFLPTELIDYNGAELKKYILQYTAAWNLPAEFAAWVEAACKFTNTLVDRIVPGYPKDKTEVDALEKELGYTDELLVTAEPFNIWVIEGKQEWKDILPLHKTNPNVVWTDNVAPYKTRKVRILNGAHTATVPAAYLAGHTIVLEFMNDPIFKKYVDGLLFDEVIPTLDLPRADLEAFAKAVNDRFANPYIKHALLDISLNCCSKFNARCLPSLLEYNKRKGELPKILTFALAAFIKFYQGTMIDGAFTGTRADGTNYAIKDAPEVIEFFNNLYSSKPSAAAVAKAVLSKKEFWSGQDLTEVKGLEEAVAKYLEQLNTKSVKDIVAELVK